MRRRRQKPSREICEAEAALKRAVRRVFLEAERTGKELAVWKNGRVVMVRGGARSRAA